MSELNRHDPEGAIELWARVREEARDEIESGHRAAEIVSQGYDFGPLDRAKFLEVRPLYARNGIRRTDLSPRLSICSHRSKWDGKTGWLGHLMEMRFRGVSGDLERQAKREGGWLPGTNL